MTKARNVGTRPNSASNVATQPSATNRNYYVLGQTNEDQSDDEFGWGRTESRKAPAKRHKEDQTRRGVLTGLSGPSKIGLNSSSSSTSLSEDEDKDTLNGLDEMTHEKKEESDNEGVKINSNFPPKITALRKFDLVMENKSIDYWRSLNQDPIISSIFLKNGPSLASFLIIFYLFKQCIILSPPSH